MALHSNLIAVYTPGGIITTARMARIAATAGRAVRFLALGGIALRDDFRGGKRRCESGLLCGWPEAEAAQHLDFDAACEAEDRARLISWFQ